MRDVQHGRALLGTERSDLTPMTAGEPLRTAPQRDFVLAQTLRMFNESAELLTRPAALADGEPPGKGGLAILAAFIAARFGLRHGPCEMPGEE